MSEPRRLSEGSESDLERVLLRAGRAPAPTAARHRAVVAATTALATSGLAAGTAAAGGAVAKTGAVAVLKWVGIAGFVGLTAVAADAVIEQRHATTTQRTHAPDQIASVAPVAPSAAIRPAAAPIEAPAPSVTLVESPPADTAPLAAPTAAPPQAFAPTTAPAPAAVRRATPSAEPTASNGSSVPAELATLDQARSSLASGNPARALSILDGYSMRFPHASMASEATVLRIEALVNAGDRAAAQRVADSFLYLNPRSPYAARIRSLVGSNP